MEKEIEFKIEKLEGSDEVRMVMHTSLARALAIMGSAICDLASRVREEYGEEAYEHFLGFVGDTLSAKNLWEVMNGEKKGFLAKLVDKIFK